MNEWTPYLGYLGAVLTAVNFLPQVIKAFQTRNVDDLSIWMLVLVITAQAVWILYAWQMRLLPVLLSNSCLLLMALVLLALKLVFGGRGAREKKLVMGDRTKKPPGGG